MHVSGDVRLLTENNQSRFTICRKRASAKEVNPKFFWSRPADLMQGLPGERIDHGHFLGAHVRVGVHKSKAPESRKDLVRGMLSFPYVLDLFPSLHVPSGRNEARRRDE